MKIDARGWIFQIAPADEPTTWLDIGGITEFEVDPSENNEDVDTTTFASDGEYEGEMMQRGASMEIEGFRDYDEDTGERDPGQARVDELGTKKGRESVGAIRFRHDTEDEWTNWGAYNEPGSYGGGNNDKTSWSATLNRTGAASVTAVEVATP